MKRIFIVFFLLTYSLVGYTWNAAGHKLVAQIAYDNLTPVAKKMCGTIFNINDPKALEAYFINVATWLDEIRKKNIHQYDGWHYMNIPFSNDKTKLPELKHKNALWAIQNAIAVLSSNKSGKSAKSFNLKVLIHVVGDMHQPLHTSTKVSRRFPKGDLGGNLYALKSPYGANLHQYWDNGAGTLTKGNLAVVKVKAYLLEQSISCLIANQLKTPEEWLQETLNIAKTEAYAIKSHNKPSKKYRYNTIRIVDKQIVLAGCRLAYLLNAISSKTY